MVLESWFLAKLEILGISRACKAPIFDFGFFCLFMDKKVSKFSVFAKNAENSPKMAPKMKKKEAKFKNPGLIPNNIFILAKNQLSNTISGRNHSIHSYSRFKIFDDFQMYGISYILYFQKRTNFATSQNDNE